MQTIATSLTSRRGVLIENLTVAFTNAELFESRTITETDPDVTTLNEREVNSNFLTDVGGRIYKTTTISDMKLPRGMMVPSRQTYENIHSKTPESSDFKGWMHSPLMDSEIPKIEYDQSKTDSTTLLIIYGGPKAGKLFDDFASKSQLNDKEEGDVKVVTDLQDLKDLKEKKCPKLMVYKATRCEDMVQWIDEAKKKNILVSFMGVDLKNVKKYDHWTDNQPINPDKSYHLVRSSIETMIEQVVKKARDANKSISLAVIDSRRWIRLEEVTDADFRQLLVELSKDDPSLAKFNNELSSHLRYDCEQFTGSLI